MIEVDDRPLGFSRKAQERPLALLKALVAFGGRGVPQDRLIDALWPDAEGDAGRQAFKTALHRLRQLLAHDGVLLRQQGRVSVDPRACWVDAWAAERALDEAAAAGRRGDTGAAALALYRGPLLDADERLSWTANLRDRLRGKLIRVVAQVARQREREGHSAQSAELYERGLAVEPLADDLYRGLIDCHERYGRRHGAAGVQRRWTSATAEAPAIRAGPQGHRARGA